MSKDYSVLHLILLLLTFKCVSSVIIQPSNLESFDSCGGEYSGYQYSVTSPDYPKNYTEFQDCIYLLRGSHLASCSQVFHLQFTNFSLRSSPNCEQDYLIIGDSNVLCGEFTGIKTYPSKNNTLALRFHSGKGGSYKGFKILVTTLPCPVSTEAAKSMVNNRKQSGIIYPSHRPDDIFPVDNDHSTVKKEFQSKSNSNNNQDQLNHQPNLFLDDLKPPLHPNKFDKNQTTMTKVSAYFFEDPEDEKKNEIPQFPTDLSIPTLKDAISGAQNANNSSLDVTSRIGDDGMDFRNNQKLISPEKIYGIPPGKPYAPLPNYSPQVHTGEVRENAFVDCNTKSNDGVFPNNYPGVIPPSFPSPAAFPPSYGPPPRFPPPPQQPPVYPIVPQAPILPPHNLIPSNADSNFPLRQCCNAQHSSLRFLLSNPGFPSLFYSEKPYDCAYIITPYPNVCRLRFTFKYFNYGLDEDFCGNGYIEVDGRRYCGCKTGLSFVSNVVDSYPKIVRVRYLGFPRVKHNGFLIEVNQESCFNNNNNNNYPYLSRNKKQIIKKEVEVFQIPRNKRSDDWNVNRLLNETQREKRTAGYFYPKPNVDFPTGVVNFGNINSGFIPQTSCQATNLLSWAHASKEVYLRGGRCLSNNLNGGFIPNYPPGTNYYPGNQRPGYLPPNAGRPIPPNVDTELIPSPGLPGLPGVGYPGAGNAIPLPSNCQYVRLNARDGTIPSPGYPNYYPPNTNICFRFIRAPGACKLHLSILEFDLENSRGCGKDFLFFINQNTKYCGRTIAGSKTLITFPPTGFIDIQFVSDAFGTGRGFNIVFSQI
ncbi:uncharacterized protein [Chelonus insularis]|uniref:uncharacterized protein n=1 Tax=Chelonus insularis TaxID=460826 RepID=UPI0015897455|nr:uncharacterized protein LOC118073988 [Chelonus insularis]